MVAEPSFRRRLAAALSALLALAIIGQLLALIANSRRGFLTWDACLWFGSWGLLALLAALAPWLYPYLPRVAGWLPYAAAALFLGLAAPGLFSIIVHMTLAGLLDLAAGWLLVPSWRRVLLTLAVAAGITLALFTS
ncbi:MAG: hypothetical protein GXO37_02480 [Chloroflexi bacterium]|nr:hypothetical protein [Chloroflexota bacterium]